MGTTYVVVRHAEKVDQSRDPDLSPAGHARAQALARRFADTKVIAAYATDYRRTRQTLGPIANAHSIPVTLYDAARPAADFVGTLRAAFPRGTVVIAGHGNTVPAIVSALCACKSAPMAEDEFDRLSIVRIDASGEARLEVGRYDADSPP